MSEHSHNSSYREKLIEHLLIGELLKLSWQKNHYSLEISKPEVDNSGYDLIMEANGVLRHVQLKASYIGGSTSQQKIHIALAEKSSGCVVWVMFDQVSLDLGPFLFFGGLAGEPLPSLAAMKVAKHTKGDALGHKAERPNIRVLNKGHFQPQETIDALYHVLFGK